MIIQIGGTGFIGKHLCCALQARELSSVTFSRNPDNAFLQNHTPSIVSEKIENLASPSAMDWIEQATTLVYLASSSTPATLENTALREFESSISAAIKLVDFVLNINPSIHIIYISSGGTIYGSGHKQPILEESQLNPTTPYAFGKVTIENFLRMRASKSELKYTILRPSNPVGRFHKNVKQGIVGAALDCIKNKKTLTVFGDGESTRDYVDADELANGIISAALNPSDSINKTWNIGSGQPTTINQIIQDLNIITQEKLRVDYKPARHSDIDYNVLDCKKIEKDLGWRASLGIKEILRNQWDFLHAEHAKL